MSRGSRLPAAGCQIDDRVRLGLMNADAHALRVRECHQTHPASPPFMRKPVSMLRRDGDSQRATAGSRTVQRALVYELLWKNNRAIGQEPLNQL